MVQELITGVLNQYELTMRGRPIAWTEDVWADVYSFERSGLGLASRVDKFATEKFRSSANSKKGYDISKDDR